MGYSLYNYNVNTVDTWVSDHRLPSSLVKMSHQFWNTIHLA